MSTTSVVNDIVQAAVAALGVASVTLPSGTVLTKPDGLTVNRYRAQPIDKAVLPDIVVYCEADVQLERVGPESAPISDRHFLLSIDCRAIAATGTAPDLAIDPYVVWAIAALMADQTFGGLASGCQHQTSQWSAAASDKIYTAASLGFVVRYAVDAADPTYAEL